MSVLRGNISEIRFIAGLATEIKGADASEADRNCQDEAKDIAKSLVTQLGCVVAIIGKEDTVSDGKNAVCISNEHSMLSCPIGTGCMCSSLIGSFCGTNPDAPLESAAAALLSMGIAGQIVFEIAGSSGNDSFRIALHDAISQMNAEVLRWRSKLHEV